MAYAKKTKPALYLSLPSYRRKAVVKQARRVGPGHRDFKSPGVKEYERPFFKRNQIRPVSWPAAKRNAEYAKNKKEFFSDGRNCVCARHMMLWMEPKLFSVEIHHTRGKLGPLKCDTRFWRPLCRECHIWIDANRDKARALGLLCKSGYNDMRQPDLFEKAYRSHIDGARKHLLHPNDTPPEAHTYDLTDWEANQIRKQVDKEMNE